MQPMYPDAAQAYLCPFSLPAEKQCHVSNCLAWEDVPKTDGMGMCTRLSRRRVIQSLSARPLEVVTVDLSGDDEDGEVM